MTSTHFSKTKATPKSGRRAPLTPVQREAADAARAAKIAELHEQAGRFQRRLHHQRRAVVGDLQQVGMARAARSANAD